MIRMRITGLAVSALVVVGLASAGCAPAARRSGLNSRLVRPAPHSSKPVPAPYEIAGRADSLETVIGKIRALAARARPAPKQISGPTIESFDRQLAAALLALNAFPGGETHRRVAAEYARLGVFDAAYTHYRAALVIDPHDGAAFEGLARLWRDVRLPALALGDAQRAVYHDPRSAAFLNTLGTVLQALGQNREARKAYERVLALQPGAAFALNNLGYLALVEGNTTRALAYGRAAVAADATLVAARHNLALAYAAAGRMDLARATLSDTVALARADYNLGIINLARGEPAEAIAAFEAACRVGPAQRPACERATALKSQAAAVEGGTE
jgi:tetratricopeptide (TPR) repeat protein